MTRLELGTYLSVCELGVALGIAITYLPTGCPRASALPSLGLTLMWGRSRGSDHQSAHLSGLLCRTRREEHQTH